jgi:hypothetical protein
MDEKEEDLAFYVCGIFYDVKPRVQVSLVKNELIEDIEIKEYRQQIDNNAKKFVDRVSSREIEWNEKVMENHEKLFAEMKKYFEDHLTAELKRTAKRLVKEVHTSDLRGEQRDINIRLLQENEEKELRKRIPAAKGRVPIKAHDSFKSEKEEFIKQCIRGFEELEKRKKKINKTQLSEILVEGLIDTNPLQTLRRKLKKFDLTFEEIFKEYTEQKSS